MLIFLDRALYSLIPLKFTNSKSITEKRKNLIESSILEDYRLVETKTVEKQKIVRLVHLSNTTKKAENVAGKILKITDALADKEHSYYIDLEKRPDSSLTPFFLACKAQNLTHLKELYALKGPSLFDEKGYGGVNGLIHIIKNEGDLKILEWMLSLKPEFIFERQNTRGYFQRKPLWTPQDSPFCRPSGLDIACEYGRIDIINWLFDQNFEGLDNEAILGQAFLYSINKGSFNVAKLILSKKPSILSFQDKLFLKKAFSIAVGKDQLSLVKWLHKFDPEIYKTLFLNAEGEPSPMLALEAFEKVKKSTLFWLYEIDPNFVHELAIKYPFFENYILNHCLKHSLFGDPEILDFFYRLNRQSTASDALLNELFVILSKEFRSSTNIQKICLYLIEKDFIPTSWSRRFLYLTEAILNGFNPAIFKTKFMLHLWRSYKEDPFSPDPNTHKRFFADYLKSFQSEKKIIVFESASEPLPQGEALIDYYNQKIDDIEKIADPFHELTMIFSSLDPDAFHEIENRGLDSKSSKEETSALLSHHISRSSELLNGIKYLKPDAAIPKGIEEKYYLHLTFILKHLVTHLKEKNSIEETLTFLTDLSASSGFCFANFSAQLYSIYNRIQPSSEITSATKQTNSPHEIFVQRFKDYLIKMLKNKASQTLFSTSFESNAHVNAIYKQMFDYYHIPHPEIPTISDTKTQEEYYLEVIADKYQIFLNDNQSLKLNVFEFLKQRFLRGLFDQAEMDYYMVEFLSDSLAKDDSSDFLNHLGQWMEYHSLSMHNLLEWEEESETYKIKSEEVKHILAALPKVLTLFS